MTLKERREKLAAEQKEQKRMNDIKTKIKRMLRSDITHSGILSVKYKLEHIINNPGSEMKTELSREVLIGLYNEVIEHHINKSKDGK